MIGSFQRSVFWDWFVSNTYCSCSRFSCSMFSLLTFSRSKLRCLRFSHSMLGCSRFSCSAGGLIKYILVAEKAVCLLELKLLLLALETGNWYWKMVSANTSRLRKRKRIVKCLVWVAWELKKPMANLGIQNFNNLKVQLLLS